MEDKDQVIKELKAELYDMNKSAQQLGNILSDVASALKVREGASLEDLGQRIQELIELEEEFYEEE